MTMAVNTTRLCDLRRVKSIRTSLKRSHTSPPGLDLIRFGIIRSARHWVVKAKQTRSAPGDTASSPSSTLRPNTNISTHSNSRTLFVSLKTVNSNHQFGTNKQHSFFSHFPLPQSLININMCETPANLGRRRHGR